MKKYNKPEIIIENAIGAPEDEWEKGATNKYGETTYTYKTPEGITVEKIVKDGHVLYYQAKYQDIEGSKGFNQCEYVYFDSSGEKISYYDSEALKKTSRSDYNNTTLWSKDGNNYSYTSGDSLYNSYTIVTTDSDGKPLFYILGIIEFPSFEDLGMYYVSTIFLSLSIFILFINIIQVKENKLKFHNQSNVDLFKVLSILYDRSKTREQRNEELRQYEVNRTIDEKVIDVIAATTNIKIKHSKVGELKVCTLWDEVREEGAILSFIALCCQKHKKGPGIF